MKRKKNYLPLTLDERIKVELCIKRLVKVIRYKVKKGEL